MTMHNQNENNNAQANTSLGASASVNLVFVYYAPPAVSEVVHRASEDDDGQPACNSGANPDNGEYVNSKDDYNIRMVAAFGVDLKQVTCKRCLKKINKEK